jgi:hypothetical protein
VVEKIIARVYSTVSLAGCVTLKRVLTIKVLAVALTSRSIPREARAAVEVWLWPNVLNLEAPFIAVIWQMQLARDIRMQLNAYEPWVLGLAVWFIYIADHLIDTARTASGAWEPPRKTFFRQHWRQGLAVGIAVGLVLIVCGGRVLWASTVRGGVQLGFAVAGYFSLTHLTPARWRIRWPREVVVALLFTSGTFGPVWLGNGRHFAPLVVPAAIFLLLCWTNCSLIETWEWEEAGEGGELDAPDRMARWAAGHAGVLVAVIAGLAFLRPSEFAAAGVMSAVGLWVMRRKRETIAIRFVSPLADLALCTPIAMMLGRW